MAEMRSYEAARTLYSFLGLLAWCVILLGIVIAIGGATAGSQFGSFGRNTSGMAMVMGAAPGLAIGFIGFLGLAVVQNGRAAVDTAELTQQMLKVARDQLEVSQQALKGTDGHAGYEAFVESAAKNGASERVDGASNASYSDSVGNEPEVDDPREQPKEVRTYDVNGKTLIEREDGSYVIDSRTFSSLEEVKQHLRLEGYRNAAIQR